MNTSVHILKSWDCLAQALCVVNLWFLFFLDDAAEELNKILLLMLGCAVQVSDVQKDFKIIIK